MRELDHIPMKELSEKEIASVILGFHHYFFELTAERSPGGASGCVIVRKRGQVVLGVDLTCTPLDLFGAARELEPDDDA